MAFPSRLNVAPKHCEKHNLTYDVGDCHLCDIENGTGDIGRFARNEGNRGSEICEVRSGYRGEIRAQYRGQVERNFRFNRECFPEIEVVPDPVVEMKAVCSEPEEELHPNKRKFRNIA
jgi:hypothetical protein